MDGTKSWLTSKGVIGGIIATLSPVIILVIGFLGGNATPGDVTEAAGIIDGIQESVIAIIGAVGGLIAIWGRVTAKKVIG